LTVAVVDVVARSMAVVVDVVVQWMVVAVGVVARSMVVVVDGNLLEMGDLSRCLL
jgi:hypothetical protein